MTELGILVTGLITFVVVSLPFLAAAKLVSDGRLWAALTFVVIGAGMGTFLGLTWFAMWRPYFISTLN
jgi:hypothetical protein